MDKAKQVRVEPAPHGRGPRARDTDRLHFDKVNFWWDVLPGDMGERLTRTGAGCRLPGPWSAFTVLEQSDR